MTTTQRPAQARPRSRTERPPRPRTIQLCDGELGKGLLPDDLGKGLENLLLLYGAAYRNVLSESEENLALWHSLRVKTVRTIQARYARIGATAAPWDWAALWRRIDRSVPDSDPNAHVELVRALLTNFQSAFLQHIRYRLSHNGNVHLDFSGPTGMGKSSAAMSVANWIRPIDAHALERYLAFDLGELPQKLTGKEPGETVLLDEYVQSSGEGSRTFQNLLANLMDTMRASRVNLFTLSPGHVEHSTMQAELEVILWNPEKRFSIFLVWIKGHPHGVVALPWAPDALWNAYSPWKANNVRRSLAGHFRDNTFLARAAMRAFDDPRLVAFLMEGTNKPKRGDFQTAWEFFCAEMMSGTQSDRIVGFMHSAAYNFKRLEPQFTELFGVEPNDGLRKVARRCHED